MAQAAHNMVRFMTAGMALITVREPLLLGITGNIKQGLLAALRVSILSILLLWEEPCSDLIVDNFYP